MKLPLGENEGVGVYADTEAVAGGEEGLIDCVPNREGEHPIERFDAPLAALVDRCPDAAPDLLKPNREELEELTGRPLGDREALAGAARELVEAGISTVVVSLGGEGALFVRAGDLARGPLSARVASLYILAGRPDRALDTLRKSEDESLPDAMIAQRNRVEAVALSQIGRTEEALAVLETVPGSAALQGEILWKHREWQRYADATAASLPAPRALDPIGQAVVLRHAISLAMLGREDALAALHGRYGPAFAGLPTAPVFAMLTASPMQADPAALGRAMAALPSASPAGDLADLLERAPDVAPVPTRGAKPGSG